MTKLIQDLLTEALQRGYIAAYRILGSPEDARDACQEAATRALAARGQYDQDKPFYPWFYRILKNHCLDRIRRRKQRPQETQVELVSTDASAEQQLATHEQERVVNQKIRQLPEEMREILELRHFQDLSYEEIAEVLDCPKGTVMSRLYRARKALRRFLIEDPAFRFEHSQDEKKA